MSTYFEFEADALPEMETLYESEWEGETPGAFESEQFFQELSQAANRAAPVPALQRLALESARSALRQGGITSADGLYEIQNMLGQAEMEGGYEGELEQAVSYMNQLPSSALMEHLGHAAAEAETEGESFAFLAPLLPLAAKAIPLAVKGLGFAGKLAAKKILPKVISNVTRSIPQMTRSLQGVARTLSKVPNAKPLKRTLPTIAKRSVAAVTRQAASGRPVTPQVAARTVAQQAAKVIGNPRQAVQAYRQSASMDRKYHRGASTAIPPTPAVAPAASATAPTESQQPASGYPGYGQTGMSGGAMTGRVASGRRQRGCCCCRCC